MPKTADPQGNREKLLQAAVVCLQQRGYGRTTARDLTAVSGANLASIGYHFGGKEALLNQAVAENTRAWMSSIEKEIWAQEPENVRELLRRLFAITVDRFAELEPYLHAFVEAFPPAVRSQPLRAEIAAAYNDVRDSGEALLESILVRHGGAGRADARVLCSILIALCDGLILQWLLDPDATPGAEEILASLDGLAAALCPPPESVPG